ALVLEDDQVLEAGEEANVDLAAQAELGLQRTERVHVLAGTLQVDLHTGAGRQPVRLAAQRAVDVATRRAGAQPLPDLPLVPPDRSGQPQVHAEEAMIDGAHLGPQPAGGGVAFGLTEPGHAADHRPSIEPAKVGQGGLKFNGAGARVSSGTTISPRRRSG